MNVGAECGLTIAGFYYVCFSRSDGSVHGFYYDPNSTYGLHKYISLLLIILFFATLTNFCSPFQKLELKALMEGQSGYCFASYQFA